MLQHDDVVLPFWALMCTKGGASHTVGSVLAALESYNLNIPDYWLHNMCYQCSTRTGIPVYQTFLVQPCVRFKTGRQTIKIRF